METATAEIISPNISTQIDESQQNINILNRNWERAQGSLNTTAQIEGVTKLTSGIMSLSMAVQQFQRLGSIWTADDIPFG